MKRLLPTFVFALLSAPIFGANCELSTEADNGSDVSYKDRGDRCEGFYRQNVSGRVNLRVVGYHANRVSIEQRKNSWIVELNTRVDDAESPPTIKIASLRPTDYFQMDTNQVSSTGSFTWESRLLAKMEYPPKPRHLAAVACLPNCSSSQGDTLTMFPISFGVEGLTDHAERSFVFVMADVDLRSLKATLVDRNTGATIFEDRAVGGNFIPAKRANRILVQSLTDVATLTLVGETHSGRKAFLEVNLSPLSRPN